MLQTHEQNSVYTVWCLAAQSCPTLCDPMDCSPPGSSVHGDSPGKNTGVGCHSLLQEIFPTLGSNLGLLHCRQILFCLSHWEAQDWTQMHVYLSCPCPWFPTPPSSIAQGKGSPYYSKVPSCCQPLPRHQLSANVVSSRRFWGCGLWANELRLISLYWQSQKEERVSQGIVRDPWVRESPGQGYFIIVIIINWYFQRCRDSLLMNNC